MTDDIATEKHYTEPEIGKLWHMHRNTVHRHFDDQPGVIEFGIQGLGKKKKMTRRIPESVMIRVHRDLQNKKK